MKRTRTLVVAALVLAAAICLLLVAALFFSEQAAVVRELRQAAADARTRGVPFPNSPSYAFADLSNSPFRELIGPQHTHTITDVAFEHFDERQLLDSIVPMQRLSKLERIVLSSPLAPGALAHLHAALPGVEIVVRQAPAP